MLFALLVLTSLVPASMLVAVPLLILFALSGIRSGGLIITTVVAMFIVLAGQRDPLWYAERGWAVMLGGCFAAVTLLAPWWRLTSRAPGGRRWISGWLGSLLCRSQWGLVEPRLGCE